MKKQKLRKALTVAWIMNRDKGMKKLEVALQETIEEWGNKGKKEERCWWEIADVDIFVELFAGINEQTKEKIIDSIVECAV